MEQRPTKRRRKALISIDTDDAGYTIRKIKAHRLMQIRTTLSRFLRYKNFSKKVLFLASWTGNGPEELLAAMGQCKGYNICRRVCIAYQ